MRKLNSISLASTLVLGSLVVGCSARNIVTESNPYLDPTPVTTVVSKQGVDPLAKDQWNLSKIGITAASTQTGSRRIKVAVLSTGVDYTHEDLAANIFINRGEWKDVTPGAQSPLDGEDSDRNGYKDDFIGYDFVENDGLPYDRNGAGTAMAGVLGAVTGNGFGISGVVKDISIVPVRFIDSSGHVLFPNLLKALNYALETKVDVILLQTPSYEFGSTAAGAARAALAEMERQMLKQSLEAIRRAGIPVVASAGNSGSVVGQTNSLATEISRYTNVVVVTSVDQADERPFISNFGREKVHISAPGKDILTTAPDNKYTRVSSTSVAAAQVAGTFALAINQTYGRIEPQKLVETLLKTDSGDVVERLKYETISGSRLNVAKYLSQLK